MQLQAFRDYLASSSSTRRSHLRAELLFLVAKLLEDESYSDVSSGLKRFMDENNILPPRINFHGKEFPNTVENYEYAHGPIRPFMLLELVENLFRLVQKSSPSARTTDSLFSLSTYLNARQQKSVLRPVFLDPVRTSPRDSMLDNLHRRTRLSHNILAHRSAVYCLQFDQRGEYVFTGSDDYTIKMWSLNTMSDKPCSLRHAFRGHVAEIIELAVSLDNHLLASVDSNCCLVIWCLRSGQPVVSLRGSRSNRVISGMAFVGIPATNEGQKSNADCEQLSDSGVRPTAWLVVTSFGGFVHMIPYEHRIFDRSPDSTNPPPDRWTCCNLTLLPTVQFTTSVDSSHNMFWPSVVCMDVSPGSLMVAAGCSDQSIRLYQFVDPYKPQLSEVLHAHDDSVNSVAFSHCGLKLASGSSDGGSCWLWRLQAGKWRSLVLSFRKRVKCRPCLLAWSKTDAYLIASMKNGSVYVYFGESGRLATVIEGHEGAVHAIAPSPLDDDILATGGVDGRFQLWNIRLHRALVSTESEGSNPNREHEFHPLLCHHRFHPCEFDPEVGLVWHPLGPGEDASIWTYPNGSRRSSQRDQVASSSYHRPGGQTARDSASQGQLGVLPSISGSLRQQRITACRAVPTCEGVGFLVVTKSGLLSVFRPEEASLDSQSFQSQTRPNICDVDEQFFHWELDTAEWKEVCHNTPDLVTRITLALGSPTAPQSVAGLMASRYDRTGRNSRITSGTNVSESRENQSDSGTSRAGPPRNIYRPPPSVCFEIVHAPSKVPFHRLPPPYLTNLRGAPLPPNQQRNVPGRSNLRNQLDLLPSVAIDEEVGAEVVVDDIQFCSNIPSDYCPTPVLCSSRPTPGKQYLWESVWLNGSTPLIDSLSPSDLRQRIHEQTSRYRDELAFFLGQGDARVTFGDRLMSTLHNSVDFVPVQPVGRGSLAQTICMSQTEALDPADAPDAVFPNDTASSGLSFIHSFSANSGAHTQNTLPTSSNGTIENLGNSSAPPPSSSGEAISSSHPTSLAPLDDLDDPDDNAEDSEESEWSEHIDVDIGWWHRQRRRRQRRQAVVDNSTSQQSVGSRDRNDDAGAAGVTPTYSPPGRTTQLRRRNMESTHSVASHCRRSARQQRRRLLKRRMLREKRIAEARAERDRRRLIVRRSQRFQRRDSVAPETKNGTSCTDKQLDSNKRVSEPESCQPPVPVPYSLTDDDYIGERRERLKRRLIKSIDHALSRTQRVPVSSHPPGGYEGPDCEGSVYPTALLNPPSGSRQHAGIWKGPHFDWLSTYHSVATPYVPQMGDHVVYITQGHRQYMQHTWHGDSFPNLHQFANASDDTSSSTNVINQLRLPWDEWPQIPAYVCGEVLAVTHTIVRISLHSAVSSRTPTRKRSRSRRYCPPWARSDTRHRAAGVKRSADQAESLQSEEPSDSTRGADSFVRLVSLRVRLEERQPYAHLSAGSTTSNTISSPKHQPDSIDIIYHDVDGVLDFVILRHVFDSAMQHFWNPGDFFVCPVGTVWWRGRVLRSLCAPQPSCSTSGAHRSQPGPWLSILVQWLQTSDATVEPFDPKLVESCSSELPENVDQLSPWDLFPWDCNDSSDQLASSLQESDFVHVPYKWLRAIYGTPSSPASSSSSPNRLSVMKPNDELIAQQSRIIRCFEQLMRIPASESFNTPVDFTTYPDYLFVNPYPIDLGFIVARLRNGFYRQMSAIREDLRFLLENTVRYNEPNSEIVLNARVVHELCTRCLDCQSLQPQNVQQVFDRLKAAQDSCTASSVPNSSHIRSSRATSRGEPLNASARSHSTSRVPDMDDIHSGTSSSSSGDQTELRRRRPPCNSPDSLTRRTRRSVHYSSPVVTSHAQSSTFFPSSTCSDCPALSPASWAPALLSELKRLISNPRSLFFRNPIDVSTYPDYPCVVSSPMDLSTITRHLNTVLSSAHQCRSLRSMPKTHYRCAHDCLRDLNLIVTNSKKYNTDPNTAVYEDTVWLESWITETFVPFISNTLSTTHSPSPGPNHSESRSVRSARRMSHRTPMRQSNLACRRLALRKARSRCIRQRLSGLKAATSIAPESTVAATRHVRIPEPPPSFPRTSRGRIVRPPKRDEHIVIFSDTDVSDSDEHSRIAKVTRRTTTAQTVATRSACFVYESLVGSSNLGSRRSKRRRRVL